ncbi:MAG: sugar kinase [Thermodesulfobacteriota bacterium]
MTRVPDSKLAPFPPGDSARFVFPPAWGGRVRPWEACAEGTVCEVEVPARLHASVTDMNRFGIGRPGGGGIGFAVALHSRARAVLRAGPRGAAGGTRPAIAQHLCALFQELTGFRGGLDLDVTDHGHRHLGLGSSVGSLAAGAVACNEMLGRPLALRDLRKLVAHNYCEEAPGETDVLVRGFETNVGAMAALHGGMVVASDRCELVYRTALPGSMKALLLVPQLGPKVSSGEEEAQALLTRARALDRRDAAHKAYRVLMDLLPAMIQGDTSTLGDVLWDLAQLGSKHAECCLHGEGGREIYETMGALRDEGAEIVGMSSVGPAVFALSTRPRVWERWQARHGPDAPGCTLVVPVDNAGARVRLDGTPVPYQLEAWWHEPHAEASS